MAIVVTLFFFIVNMLIYEAIYPGWMPSVTRLIISHPPPNNYYPWISVTAASMFQLSHMGIGAANLAAVVASTLILAVGFQFAPKVNGILLSLALPYFLIGYGRCYDLMMIYTFLLLFNRSRRFALFLNLSCNLTFLLTFMNYGGLLGGFTPPAELAFIWLPMTALVGSFHGAFQNSPSLAGDHPPKEMMAAIAFPLRG